MAKGSTLVKVVSIIMIIGGIVGAIMTIVVIAGMGLAQAIIDGAQAQVNTGMFWVSIIFSFVGVIFEVVAGFMGVLNWQKPEKGQTLMIFGIICAVFSVIGLILYSIATKSFNFISLITGLIIPGLYTFGAFQLKGQNQ